MRALFVTLISIFLFSSINAQGVGDTIHVESFSFENTSRDLVVDFPDDPSLTFEKIILKYTMRCKDGLVSTSANRNQGCGEWDYSCNTYLVDSNKVEVSPREVASHYITNFDDVSFPYKSTPVYDYFKEEEKEVIILSTISEEIVETSIETNSLNEVINTEKLSAKSQFLYTAAELTTAGLVSGEIAGLSLNVIGSAGEVNFLKVKMKNTLAIDFSEEIELTGFTEVFNQSEILEGDSQNRFQFHTPFVWDGTSSVLVEFNFINTQDDFNTTNIAGEITSSKMGAVSSSNHEFLLANNTYIECDEYKGVAGDQNRTVEAWVKGDVVRNGEICSWGSNTTGQKWTFRMLSTGEIRVEIAGTGTVSTTKINDGEWHHVVAVLNGDNASDIRFYIDGELDVNSVTGSGVISTNTIDGTAVRINRGINNRYFDGEVDNVRIWDVNLSGETIKSWMRKSITNQHPNYANLQLNYEFEGEGISVLDSSPHGRNGTVIGRELRTSFVDGDGLFKDFKTVDFRPSLSLYQGEYEMDVNFIDVERPFTKKHQIFVSTNTIIEGDDNIAKDDEIVSTDPINYWLPEENVFDANTGDLLETRMLTPDGTIEVSMLNYSRRFPFYNELVSFVTPYGIGLNFGEKGKSWYFDMTDYVSILNGKKRILMTLGGQNQEQMDLDFMFIVGTPPRDVVQYDQVWQGTTRLGSASIGSIVSDEKFPPKTVVLSSEGEEFKLRSSITGHGAEGEFEQNGGAVRHQVKIDGFDTYQWDINQECSANPIYPQGGTWVYDRQGWCPGEPTYIEESNLSDFLDSGEEFTIDYNATNPNLGGADYRYHVAHQIVGYGPANRNLDASVVEILAPNNSALYTRTGTICANPQIRLQNTGASKLTSATIKYWLNDSATPQEYEWTGNLDFMESEVVVIPSTRDLWMDIKAENNIFHVQVSKPNQGVDEYQYNDHFTSTIDIPQVLPTKLSFRVRTNNIPTQNSYQLFDEDGNVVGSNNLVAANTTTTDDFDLPEGCYKLVFYDTGGDGLAWWANANQGTGSAFLVDEEGGLVKIFEADCGAGFEYSFTTSFVVSQKEIDFLTSIKVFPNPTVDYVQLEADEIDEAKVYVSNAVGQKVNCRSDIQSANTMKIDMTGLDVGLYYITIVKDDLKTTRGVIKQ